MSGSSGLRWVGVWLAVGVVGAGSVWAQGNSSKVGVPGNRVVEPTAETILRRRWRSDQAQGATRIEEIDRRVRNIARQFKGTGDIAGVAEALARLDRWHNREYGSPYYSWTAEMIPDGAVNRAGDYQTLITTRRLACYEFVHLAGYLASDQRVAPRLTEDSSKGAHVRVADPKTGADVVGTITGTNADGSLAYTLPDGTTGSTDPNQDPMFEDRVEKRDRDGNQEFSVRWGFGVAFINDVDKTTPSRGLSRADPEDFPRGSIVTGKALDGNNSAGYFHVGIATGDGTVIGLGSEGLTSGLVSAGPFGGTFPVGPYKSVQVGTYYNDTKNPGRNAEGTLVGASERFDLSEAVHESTRVTSEEVIYHPSAGQQADAWKRLEGSEAQKALKDAAVAIGGILLGEGETGAAAGRYQGAGGVGAQGKETLPDETKTRLADVFLPKSAARNAEDVQGTLAKIYRLQRGEYLNEAERDAHLGPPPKMSFPEVEREDAVRAKVKTEQKTTHYPVGGGGFRLDSAPAAKDRLERDVEGDARDANRMEADLKRVFGAQGKGEVDSGDSVTEEASGFWMGSAPPAVDSVVDDLASSTDPATIERRMWADRLRTRDDAVRARVIERAKYAASDFWTYGLGRPGEIDPQDEERYAAIEREFVDRALAKFDAELASGEVDSIVDDLQPIVVLDTGEGTGVTPEPGTAKGVGAGPGDCEYSGATITGSGTLGDAMDYAYLIAGTQPDIGVDTGSGESGGGDGGGGGGYLPRDCPLWRPGRWEGGSCFAGWVFSDDCLGRIRGSWNSCAPRLEVHPCPSLN